jgi:integrase
MSVNCRWSPRWSPKGADVARKNSNGTGTTRYNSDRKRWEGRITVRLDNGKPVRKMATGRTQHVVLAKLDEMRAAEQTVEDAGVRPDATVSTFLRHWIDDVLPLADLAQTTRDQYALIVRTYLSPAIGSIVLADLTVADVRRMLSKLIDTKSQNTVRQVRNVLRRALRTAEVDGLIERNVAALTDGVRVGKVEARAMTPEQARKLVSGAPGEPWGALAVLLVSTGLRRGEALGLAWADLDLDESPPTLTVRRSLKQDAEHRLYLDEPKTSGSRRVIHLTSGVVETLKAHRAKQNAERLEFGTGYGGDWPDLVFRSSVGTPCDPSRARRGILALTEKLTGEAFGPHELRHTAATLLLAAGAPLKVTSELLGHSSIRVTADTYSHVLSPARTEAADLMQEMLNP